MGRKTKLTGKRSLSRRRRKQAGQQAESQHALELNRKREATKR